MDRTGKIGVAIAIIVLLAWQVFYSKQMEKTRLAQESAVPAEVSTAQPASGAPAEAPKNTPPSGATAPTVPADAAGTTPAVAGTPATTAPKRTETLSDEEAQWTFGSFGGGIERVKLLKHQTDGEQPVVLNEFGSLPIGTLSEAFEAATLDPYEMEVGADGRSVTFRRMDPRQFLIEKRFTLPAASPKEGTKEGTKAYQMELEIRFTNKSAAPVTVPSYAVRAGSAAPLHLKDQPIYTGFNRSNGGSTKFTQVTWFSSEGILGMGKTPATYADSGQIHWVGVTNQYYSTIVSPIGETAGEALARRFQISSTDWQAGGHTAEEAAAMPFAIDGALRYPATVLEPGKDLTRKLHIFAGPREHWRLSGLGGGQEQILDFGWFGFVSRTLLSSMNLLKGVLGSYAAAIIVLTIIIKALLWPIQNRSTASMKRMQELQPKMTALRQKYENDPQRLNVEMMALYKKHGVNPLAGCLPMFVQIPIFFGFYNMLGKAVELRNSPFLWVKDLSQPDTIAVLAGVPVNVLPLLMAGTMLGQMRLTPKTGDPTQQRMFMLMPLIFVVFCYNYASGLALYWTVQNVFTIVQLLITNRSQSVAVVAQR